MKKLYNASWITGYTPYIWRKANYKPFCKPTKANYIADNYRPLEVSAQISRIFGAIVANRLLTYCSQNDRYKLKYWLLAFQPNKSIEDGLSNLVDDGYHALSKNVGINVVTMDISSAYNSIHIESLMYKLKTNFNLNGRILKWLYNYLKQRLNRVVIDNIQGEWKWVVDGLGQGSTLSPVLMAMYTNDYEPIHPKYIKLGLFVDDAHMWQNPLYIEQPSHDNENQYAGR